MCLIYFAQKPFVDEAECGDRVLLVFSYSSLYPPLPTHLPHTFIIIPYDYSPGYFLDVRFPPVCASPACPGEVGFSQLPSGTGAGTSQAAAWGNSETLGRRPRAPRARVVFGKLLTLSEPKEGGVVS